MQLFKSTAYLSIAVLILFLVSCKSKNTTESISSQFFVDSIYSNHLSEYRKHDVYLPKEYDENLNYPIIYGTDGNANVSNLKPILDSLIGYNIIEPVIFVASHANGKVADSTSATKGDGSPLLLAYRYFEYVNQYYAKEDSSYIHLKERFTNHLKYFAEEFIPNVEQRLKQKVTPDNRYFYGVSNGAGFGMSMLNAYPNLINTYLCFSVFGGDIQTNVWDSDKDYPDLYLRYGSKEPFFLKEDADYLKTKYEELNAKIDIKEFEGNHNDKFWKEELTALLPKLFEVN